MIPSQSLARPLSMAVAAILSLAAASAAQAGPTGGVVTGGDGNGTISTPSAGVTQIDQTATSLTIHWDSFDVASGEQVNFIQPSASAVALNHIGGADPSQIFGTLNANGRVFLLNPNGIIFGATAQVNVGSLVASSLDLTAFDADAGEYSFSTTAGRSGLIANQGGTLTAADGGSITLLGGSVFNSGIITAHLGTVNLGAGRAATLNFDPDGLVRFQIDSSLLTDAAGVSAAIDNTGTIEATGGQVLLTTRQASDVVASAVRNSGVIRATRIDDSGGRIRLMGSAGGVVNTGTLDASIADASTGGTVELTGGSLSLGGAISAGDTASFTATTGSITQSDTLEVTGAATFTAAAGQSITLDDTGNTFDGVVSFAAGGPGRLRDISIFDTTALDLPALTLDGDLTANASVLTQSGALEVGGDAHLTARTGSLALTATIEAGGDATLVAQVGSITQSAAIGVGGNAAFVAQGGGITQSAALSVQGNSSFTAASGQSIDLGNVDNTFTGAVSFASGGPGNLQNITVFDSTALNLQALALDGNLAVNASAITQSGALNVGGDASLTARTGSITQSAVMEVGGNATLVAQGGGITQSAALSVQGDSSFTAASGQSIDLGNADNTFTGTVSFASGGPGNLRDLSISDSTELALQALTLNGDLTANAGVLTQSGALQVGGDVHLTTRTGSLVQTAAIEAGGDATLVAQAGSITQAAALNVQGDSSFTAAAGQSIDLSNSDNVLVGTVSFASTGPGNLQNVTVFDGTALDLRALTLDGTLNANASALTQSGVLNVGGDANLTARTGSITQSAVMEVGGNANLMAQAGSITQSAAMDVGGNATFVAQAGGITQSAALNVQGDSSFTAAGGQSIDLGNADNAFTGTVSFMSGGPGNLQDVRISDSTVLDLQALVLAGDLDATGSSITQSGALSVGGNVDLLATAGNITQLVGMNVGGNANLVARGGTITQSAGLQVAGDATFAAAPGQSITLADEGNAFGGQVTFAAGDSGHLHDVTVHNAGALDLSSLTLDGDLNAVAGDAITQSGTWTVAGAVNLKTLNDAGAAITVDDDANRFGSISAAARNAGDTANAGGDILIREADDTVVGNVSTGDAQSVSIDSAGSITAQAATGISAGTLSLTAAGDIGSADAAVAWTTPNGTLRVASNGNINVAGTGNIALDQVAAGSTGNIKVVSSGDQQVGDVRAGGTVQLTSTGGSILDDGVDGLGSRLVASAAALQAVGSVGEASGVGNGALDLQVGTVTAQSQGGDVHLSADGGDLVLGQISAAGAVSLRASDGSILDAANDGVAASVTGGAVQMQARDAIGSVTDLATRQGTAILVNTNGVLSARVDDVLGQINLALADGSHPVADAGAISAGGSGRLLLQSGGDLSLDGFDQAITGFAETGFSADGTLSLPGSQADFLAGSPTTLLLRGGTDIVQSGGGSAFDLSADHLVFESGGQGGAVTLNTSVNRLDATLGHGNLTVVEADDIVLGNIDVAADASISAVTIHDDGDAGGVTRVTAGNALMLHASNGIGSADGAGGGRIDTAGELLSLRAESGSVFISHQGNVRVSGEVSGVTDLAAPSGSITVDALRSGAALTLTAGSEAAGAPGITGNITLAGLAQTGGKASLSALGGGVITDGVDAGPYLVAADTALTATAIGSQSNAVNVDVGLLNGTATQGMYIDAAGGVRMGAVTAGTVAVHAAGAMTDDGDAQTRVGGTHVTLSGSTLGAAGAGNAIGTAADSLTATASAGGVYIDERDDIILRSVSASGADNDIVITATGTIANDGDASTRISGRNLTLTAAAIGSMDANGALDTAVSSLTATSGTNLSIHEMDDLQLNAVSAGGNVAIVAGGALTDDGDAATRVSGIDVTLAAARIGAADARIGTAATVLGANASDGGIYIDEFDAVTLSDVRSSGTGNGVDLRTAHNGSIEVQTLTTQGGAVTLLAGGTGSLTITGALESNNGVVNLTSGNALAVPGLDTGAGSVILRTVHDLNVGDINASSVSITSENGNVALGRVNAGSGTVSVTANNGSITDATSTSLSAGDATLTALSIGSDDNPLDVAVTTLTANASAGGVFISDAGGLSVLGIDAAGVVNLLTSGALAQSGAIASGGHAIAVVADSIDMLAGATTLSSGGDIAYVAKRGDIILGVLDAGSGRLLAIAANSVYSALDSVSTANNLSGAAVEVRAGGLGGSGVIGSLDRPLSIATPDGIGRSVYLVVPAINGIQTSVPQVRFAGASSALLLKGYSGVGGGLLFDVSSAFTPDTVLGDGESIVPLRNGRVAVNADSLSAAKQALSSGVVTRVNVDWAAFDPNVTLFSTVDSALRLPDDQLDEPVPEARLFPAGTVPPTLRP